MTVIPAGTEVPYTVTWLDMTARPSYDWPSVPNTPPVSLMRATDPPYWYFQSLYKIVGRDYAWEDGLDEPDADRLAWFDPAHMTLYSLIGSGWPHGFFLLDDRGGQDARDGEETTELAYFGLVPEAVGLGLGTYLLRTAVLTAWQRPGLERLVVNTCTLDHPRALGTYQKNGFNVYRQSQHTRVLRRDKPVF